MTPEQVEIGLAAALQIGVLIFTLGKMEARATNIEGWLRNVSAKADATADLAAKHEGQLETYRSNLSRRNIGS
jgi:hypothetical protein